MRSKMRVPFNMMLPYRKWNNLHFARGCDLPIMMATIQYSRTRVSLIIDESEKKIDIYLLTHSEKRRKYSISIKAIYRF